MQYIERRRPTVIQCDSVRKRTVHSYIWEICLRIIYIFFLSRFNHNTNYTEMFQPSTYTRATKRMPVPNSLKFIRISLFRWTFCSLLLGENEDGSIHWFLFRKCQIMGRPTIHQRAMLMFFVFNFQRKTRNQPTWVNVWFSKRNAIRIQIKWKKNKGATQRKSRRSVPNRPRISYRSRTTRTRKKTTNKISLNLENFISYANNM